MEAFRTKPKLLLPLELQLFSQDPEDDPKEKDPEDDPKDPDPQLNPLSDDERSEGS